MNINQSKNERIVKILMNLIYKDYDNVDDLLDNEEDEFDDDDDELMDVGMNGQLNGANGPNAQFWQQSIGPFLYTFKDANSQMVRQLWRPILDNLNELRQQNLGPSSRKLVKNGMTEKMICPFLVLG